jgi:type II secretory pathway component PulF
MPRFWYLTDRDAAEREYVEAENLCDALQKFKAAGTAVTQAGAVASSETAQLRAAPLRLLAPTYGHLARLLEDGTPLPEALEALAREAGNERLRRSLITLARDVREGSALSEAMARQPASFSSVAVAVVRASEQGPGLADGLRSLGEQQDQLNQVASRIALPLAYPILLSFILFWEVLFIVLFIAPKYLSLYTELGMKRSEFPVLTRLLLFAGVILPWMIVAVLVPAVCLLVFYLIRRSAYRGRFELDRVRLRVPLFGALGQAAGISRMTGTLGLLLKRGTRVDIALRLAGRAAGNAQIHLATRYAEARVNQGGKLVDGLRESRMLPESLVSRIGAAEASGELPDTLERLAREYQESSVAMARTWALTAGPIIVLFLGLMVGTMAFSLFAPLTQIIQQLSGS